MQLDPQQKEAVTTDSKKCLVLAGAGSGKTRVLTERIAHLIENKKVSPFEVLSFTFTRKAAQEMKSRLENRLGNQAHKVTMSTMHAVALQLIHRFGDLIGLKSRNVTVYSEWEESYLLKEVAIDLGIFKKTWKIPKKEIDAVFSHYYEHGVEPDEYHPAYSLFRAFIGRMKENNALTYGALLTGFKLLIPFIAKHLHYRHVLVDEVQDIDPLQWQIIEELCALFNASLFVVGDISQSIYEWRGAVPSYLVERENEFDVYRLETNYRSMAPIVNVANNLIRHNEMRLPLEMKPVRNVDGPSWDNQIIQIEKNMDSAQICSYIKYKRGVDAVLCRVHGPLNKLSQLLNEAGVEHTYIGKKTALTNSEEFRRFHAFLKLVVNPYDNFAFLMIRELIGLSRDDYQAIRMEAVNQGWSHWEAWNENFLNGWVETFKIIGDALYLVDTMEELRFQIFHSNRVNIEYYEPSADFIHEWIQKNPGGSIRDYLDWLATYDLQDELSQDPECLQLMTIHAAKGLEWKTVLIAGANEGLLPSKQAIKNDEIESERRLAYVAWTRAEDQLILTVRPEISESESGKIYHNPKSRFIDESGF